MQHLASKIVLSFLVEFAWYKLSYQKPNCEGYLSSQGKLYDRHEIFVFCVIYYNKVQRILMNIKCHNTEEIKGQIFHSWKKQWKTPQPNKVC